MKIKICGITRLQDALLAEAIGCWAAGFIFVEASQRYINPEKACEITNKLSENIEKIGVFVNSTFEEVIKISENSGISKIQLHGEETPEFCSKISQITGKEVIKTFRIKSEVDLELINAYKTTVSYILLDTYSEKAYGGTGRTFNWEIAQKAKFFNLPLILAGGLNPDNLKTAYKTVKPFAVDLSSGVETSPGIKDSEKINLLKKR